jgi:hypothetical protein
MGRLYGARWLMGCIINKERSFVGLKYEETSRSESPTQDSWAVFDV